MKLIDKNKLLEKFEELKQNLSASPIVVIENVESLVESLEVKEVDLDREIYDYFNAWQNVLCDEDCCNEGGFCCVLDENVKPVNIARCRKIAKHFYELGFKAKLQSVFPELRETKDKDKRMGEEIIQYIKDLHKFGYLLSKYIEEWIPWLEKQGEHKPAESKPKFNVGDWIINGCGTIRHIEAIDGLGYQTDGGWLTHAEYEKHFRLWQLIEDAKDSDVLVYENSIFILREDDEDNDIVKAYCCLNLHNREFEPKNCVICGIWESTISPTTKEQRDLLFRKMREKGYEWDAEKKELKKIKQKPDKCDGCNNFKGCVTCVDGDQWAHYSDTSTVELPNDEDCGIDGLWHAQHILEKTLGTVDGYETDDGMLEHRCAINAVKKLCEQKSVKIGELNPETLDKAIDLYYFTYGNGKGGFDYLSLNKFKDIVKTFVKDYQLKPTWSEEEEEEFETAFKGLWGIGLYDTANWLKSLKQRLKGE